MSAVWPCPNLVSSSLRFSDSLFVTFLTSSMPPAVLHSLRSFLPVLVSLVSLSFLGPSVTHSVPSDVPAARGDEWRTEGRNERDWGPGMVAGKVGSVSLCSLFTFLSLHHRPSGPSLHSLPLRVRSLRDVPTACTEWGKNRRIRRWMTNGGTGGRYQSYRRLFQFLYDSVLVPSLIHASLHSLRSAWAVGEPEGRGRDKVNAGRPLRVPVSLCLRPAGGSDAERKEGWA